MLLDLGIMQGIFTQSNRIIVKVGSALVTKAETGALNAAWLENLAEDIAALRKADIDVVLVSSGAMALGCDVLGIDRKKMRLPELQAAAACGQVTLLQAYKQYLGMQGYAVAQVLLTIEDSENRRRYLNARNTLETLLNAGVVPVINENDTVATDEIRVGDNDRLAARVAQMVEADTLVLLSDVDGLYTANPNSDDAAEHIAKVEAITPEIEALADDKSSLVSCGGMTTKLVAAKIASASGCRTILARGTDMHALKILAEGGKHTLFTAKDNPQSARKRWIANSLVTTGEVVVDAGAIQALRKGNSLLPAGVLSVSGQFARGDAVTVKDETGVEIARGLVAYGTEDAERIIGRKTDDIAAIIGYHGRDELIHRDDLVLVD